MAFSSSPMASPSPSCSIADLSTTDDQQQFNHNQLIEGAKMRELKDQLCTLLITFADDQDPSKEITAAHTFASIRPEDYPQHRRVVHSRHSDRNEFGQLLSHTERLSQSSLSTPCGPLGSDMVEHRRVLSSPPFAASASPNSLQAEKPGNFGIGGGGGQHHHQQQQLRHSSTSASPSPRTVDSLISVHEVSLTYTRSLEDSAVADFAANRRSLPSQQQRLASSATSATTFPVSGSLYLHTAAGNGTKLPAAANKGNNNKLPYTVSRPQGEWSFQRAGDQIQISDQQPPAPKTRGFLPASHSPTKSAAVRQQQQPAQYSSGGSGIPVRVSSAEATTTTTSTTGRGQPGDWQTGRSPFSPPMPAPSQSAAIGVASGSTPLQQLPVISHQQSRSFESSEQSQMSEQRARGKAKTVFQKTTHELMTEKSVTTFGGRPKPAPPQPPARQPPRGLPRYQHSTDAEMDAHLYTRYDDPGTKRPQPQQQQPKREQRLVVEESRHVEEIYRRRVEQPQRPRQQEKAPVGMVPFQPTQKAPVLPTGPDIQKPRLIDFETYKREVEQLQRQAAAISGASDEARPALADRQMPLMSPAVVLPPAKSTTNVPPKAAEPTLETTIKYFAREEQLWQKKKPMMAKPSEEASPSDEEVKRLEEQRRLEEERRRRMVEEEEERKHRRRLEEEAERQRAEQRRLAEQRRMQEEEEQRRRRAMEEERAREEEARRRRREEEEEQRRRRETAAAPRQQQQQQQLMVATTAEVYQTVEVISSSRQPRRMDNPLLEEFVQPMPAPAISIAQKAVPVRMAKQQRTEQFVVLNRQSQLPEEKPAEKEEERVEIVDIGEEEIVESKPTEPPVDYEMDTSDMGKRLFETLRRELQYEEEIDTERRRRRRTQAQQGGEHIQGDVEAEEEIDEGRRSIGPMEEAEMREFAMEEEEVESEEVEVPQPEEQQLWREQQPWTGHRQEQLQQQQQPTAAAVVPSGVMSPRHTAKVSMSGELPPLLEEEEETSFEEQVQVLETSSTVQQQSRRRAPPPLPPPKPAHTTFGVVPLERQRDSSFSSAYSVYYPPSPAYTPYTMDYSPTSSDYRSAISARQHYPRPMRSLSPLQSGGGGHRVLKMVSETSSMSSRPLSPYPGSTAASAIRDSREKEKKEMSDLNDRLASYIEKVRFLEAQNRKLAADYEFLRNRWGRDAANVREMYEADLRQAKKLIDETGSQREELERKARAMAEEMAQLKKKHEDALRAHDGDKDRMEELLLKLAALESELAALKRRLAILEEDVKSMKRENNRLAPELQKVRSDLDQETLNRIDYQNQVQTLLEEIDFLRRAHDQEIQDLQAMASRDTTQENREMFRNELTSAMRDIREDYERLNQRNRTDIESWYKLKVQEIQTQSARQNMEQGYAKEEVKRLRVQLGDLRGKLADLEGKNSLLEKQAEDLAYQVEDDQRASESALNERDAQIRKMRDECQALMVELQVLLDTKQTLDAEIAIYRRMLEGEEDRAGGLRQLVEQVVRTHQIRQSDETESTRVLRGEKSSRQSYQRSAKGNVSILETSPEGKYVVLENTHRSKDEPIGEWKLRRRVDGKREVIYTFPRDFVLRAGKTVKVWARNQGGLQAPPDQLIFDGEESFGVGSNIQTILYNRDGEERASLIQRSSGPASRQ